MSHADLAASTLRQRARTHAHPPLNHVPPTACSEIHSINVAGCINIGDRTVTAMSTKLELDSVDISYCPNITDDAVGELLSGNDLLQKWSMGSADSGKQLTVTTHPISLESCRPYQDQIVPSQRSAVGG